MAKDKAKERDDAGEADAEDGEGATEGEGGKLGFIKKLLSNKKMTIATAAGALVFVLGGSAGAYLFLSGGKDDAVQHDKTAHAEPAAPIVPPKVAFYDMPDVVVNIQSQDGSPAYLKLSVALELQSADEVPGLKTLMPRVVDQFQGYLRELRVDDLRGSQSVMRLKEELLRRVNAAAAPYRVHDVLLKEMIVQ